MRLTRSMLSRHRDEGGAVLVLYSVMLVLMFGLVALTIDLGALRHDRRASQTLADLSAVAGAISLEPAFQGTPQKACVDAWEYFLENSDLSSSSSPCAAFPLTSSPCPPSPLLGVAAAGDYEVTITWPVIDGSALMDGRSGEPFDGTSCQRLGVQITRTRGFLFAPAIGSTQGSTGAHAVARAFADGVQGDAVSLVVLDPVRCNALYASGKAKVWVKESPSGGPGIITVDSDGSICSPSSPYAIDAKGNQNSEIKAGVTDTNGTVGPNGVIYSYAITVGNTATAYEPSDTTSGRLAPTPVAGKQVTRDPVDDRYNCDPLTAATECPNNPNPGPYIDRLQTTIGTAGKPDATYNEFPADYPGGSCSTQPSTPPMLLTGNWWVNCPTFDVSNSVSFSGGNVVFQGGVRLKSSAVLSVNAVSSTDRFVYFRSGDFVKDAQSSLILNRIFVFLKDGVIDFGAGSGTLTWIAPFDGDFEDLALWSESTGQHSLGGQTGLDIEGVFFAPKADPFRFDGQAAQYQTKAQFITYRLELSGQGTLVMTPDPERSVLIPVLGVRLIR